MQSLEEIKSNLTAALKDNADDYDATIKFMTLTTLLLARGITEQQFEDKYDLYEKLCIDSDYSVNEQNVNLIYRELTK